MRDSYEFTIDPQCEPELALLYRELHALRDALACIVKRHGPAHPLAEPLMIEHDASLERLLNAAQKRDGGGLPPSVLSLSMFRSRRGKADRL